MFWNPILGARLSQAVKAAKAPIFLIQAENDYSLKPSEVLGEAVKTKGGANRAKVFPAFGETHQDGHGKFAIRRQGIAFWETDVFEFLDRAVGR